MEIENPNSFSCLRRGIEANASERKHRRNSRESNPTLSAILSTVFIITYMDPCWRLYLVSRSELHSQRLEWTPKPRQFLSAELEYRI